MIHLLDTAGQDEYSSMRDQWIKGGNGFLLMYSVTSKESFNEMDQFYTQLKRAKEEDNVPVVLLGNKCDVVCESEQSFSYVISQFHNDKSLQMKEFNWLHDGEFHFLKHQQKTVSM